MSKGRNNIKTLPSEDQARTVFTNQAILLAEFAAQQQISCIYDTANALPRLTAAELFYNYAEFVAVGGICKHAPQVRCNAEM